MPVFAPPYNPRVRYLSALGAAPGFYPPAARAIPTLFAHRSQRKRLRLGRYNPRARYLTGLGQDDSIDTISPTPQEVDPLSAAIASNADYTQSLDLSTISPATQDVSASSAMTAAGFPSGSVIQPNTPVTYTPSGTMILTGSTAGVNNTVLLIGLGAIVLLAALSGGGGRR